MRKRRISRESKLCDKAIDWIARNHERDEYDSRELIGLISVNLVADLFDLHSTEVAEWVVQARVSLDIKERLEAEKNDDD
jgi:hypothetical protein